MAEPFEYAIKKDVRNNAIVREVDEARLRDLWKSAGVAALFVFALLFSAWQHFELLQHGYRIEEMQREKSAEEELTRRFGATNFIPLEPEAEVADGRFTVERQLAFGGFSAIYLVRDPDNKQFVLKEAVVPEDAERVQEQPGDLRFYRERDQKRRQREPVHPGVAVGKAESHGARPAPADR